MGSSHSNSDCLIIAGGDYCAPEEDILPAEHIIACDRGWVYAERLGLTPDLVVGDFDSSDPPPEGVALCRLPVEKDDTDTMYAARYACGKGYKRVVICCAFGGRLDHALANIQTGVYLARRGIRTTLLGAGTRGELLSGGERIVIPEKQGRSLSVLALSEVCRGVTIRGTKYECEGIEMTSSFPLGVSNTWAGEEAEISVESGMLLILMSELKKGEHI